MTHMRDMTLCLILLVAVGSGYAQETARGVAAGDRFEHVIALKDMPAEQMGKVMNIMSQALGVQCSHCHAGYDFAKEDTPHKAAARRMIDMTLALNRDHFAGQAVVTCMTCHQGQARGLDARLSATAIATAQAATMPAQALPPLTGQDKLMELRGDELQAALGRYPQLSGRQRADDPATIKSASPTKLLGKRLEPSGKQESEVVELNWPAMWERTTDYGQLKVSERYDQGTVSKHAGNRPIELKADEEAQIKIEARLALGLELHTQFSDWSYAPAEQIAGRTVQILRARQSEIVHHFMFDQQSGRLVGRSTSVPTVLGAYVTQVAYEDYREVQGWPMATKTSVQMPSVRWQCVLDP